MACKRTFGMYWQEPARTELSVQKGQAEAVSQPNKCLIIIVTPQTGIVNVIFVPAQCCKRRPRYQFEGDVEVVKELTFKLNPIQWQYVN